MTKELITDAHCFDLKVEITNQPKEISWWEEVNTHLNLIHIQQMMPKSTDEYFVGNEYFVG